MLEGISITRVAFARTVRLVSSARLRDSVLKSLAADEDLDALAEIEGATSMRLRAQDNGIEGVPFRELVFGVPHAHFVNAAFVYSKPLELNRFNGPSRGAWYAALAVETCLREVEFHITEFLARAGIFKTTIDYAEMFASLAGEYADLRESQDHPSLLPDPAVGYPAGNALADAVRARGLNGIIYPSVRHAGGTCIVALWPQAVQSVAPGDLWRMTWSGKPQPKIEKVTA
jgi:hypothetical protein